MVKVSGIDFNKIVAMEEKDFFEIYIPAVESALNNDTQNLSYHVRSPEFYIDDKYLHNVDLFIEKNPKYSYFFDMVAYYFDAKSHYFEEINGENVSSYRRKIIELIATFRRDFRLS